MRIVPSSTVTLYGGVEIDNGEQLAFSSKAGQTAYFQSKLVQQTVPCTMVRKTGMLRLEVAGSVVAGCNYLSFVNPDFDNKIIYARIVDYDYINNECVEIAYAIDYWQTWMFDVHFEDMYIEREHLSEDDWNKAEDNPYDPTIFEFRTDEDLIVTKDLEKMNIEISGQSGSDGLKLALGVHSITQVTDTLGVLIKMADVNLKNLDDTYIADTGWTPTGAVWPTSYQDFPSYQLYIYLTNIVSENWGFFYLSKSMYDYIIGRLPIPSGTPFNRAMYGSGWYDGGQLPKWVPFQETSYGPPLTYIYDAYGASIDAIGTANSYMGDFFHMILGFETEDQMQNTIVDMRIIPNDIMFLAADADNGAPFIGQIEPAQSIQVDSKKLMRFPFCYARVISPNGDVKELKYERFLDLQTGDDTRASLYVSMDISDHPTLIVAPSKYKVTGMSKASNVDTNIEEALYFSQFPTLPYNIDAWTAQCAAVTNDLLASRTMEAGYELNKQSELKTTWWGKTSQMIPSIANAVGMAAKGAAMDPSGIMAGAGIIAGGIQSGTAYDAMKWDEKAQLARNRMWSEGASSMGDITGGEVASQLKLTKAAYAADHYYRSDGVGTSNFNYLSYCDVILMNVSLNPDVLAVYDNYFKHYGYSSGRCGIPRICNYVAGVTADADVPHWETINGKDTTYIKTMDCKLLYSMIPVANAIRDMFNSGVRMIKGD